MVTVQKYRRNGFRLVHISCASLHFKNDAVGERIILSFIIVHQPQPKSKEKLLSNMKVHGLRKWKRECGSALRFLLKSCWENSIINKLSFIPRHFQMRPEHRPRQGAQHAGIHHHQGRKREQSEEYRPFHPAGQAGGGHRPFRQRQVQPGF